MPSNRLASPAGRRVGSVMMLGLAGFLGLGLIGASRNVHRQLLLGVVNLCVANAQTTGSAFPCLDVDLSRGVEKGFVVLRPPVGNPDTILAPTRESIGVEDPELQSDAAPNYFAAAWSERRFAPNAAERMNQFDAFGLSINSTFTRTQDHLHIHIGCLRTRLRLRLRALAHDLPIGVWSSAPGLLPGHEGWILRSGESDVDHLRPFQLAVRHSSKPPWSDIGDITLGLAPVQIGEAHEFVLLAFPSAKPYSDLNIAAEDFVDSRCGVASR